MTGHSQKYYRDADPYKDFMNPEKGIGRKGAKHKALKKKISPEMKSFARHHEKTTGEKISNRHEK